jgi:hypothetical protein
VTPNQTIYHIDLRMKALSISMALAIGVAGERLGCLQLAIRRSLSAGPLAILQRHRVQQRERSDMATDIRRMSREDLDRLNAEGRAWRERGNEPAQEPLPEPTRAEPVADMQDSMRETAQPAQLDLFGGEQ